MTYKVGEDAVWMILPLSAKPPEFPAEYMLSLNPNDERVMRDFIRRRTVPCYRSASENFRLHVKESLRWILSGGYEREHPEADRSGFEELFARDQESCIEPPDNPRDFYLWLWEELFGDEPWQIEDWSQYEYVPHFHRYWYSVKP